MKPVTVLKIEHLPLDCEICNAEYAEATIKGRHCMGGQFEQIRYACGSVVEFVPNFDRKEVKIPCPKAHHKILEMRREAKKTS